MDKKKSIAGLKVLFFGLETFSYNTLILDEMTKQGAIVDNFNVRPITSQMGKAIIKFAPGILAKKSREYFSRILDDVKDKTYDVILFIKCDAVEKDTLEEFKKTFPNADLRLHVWDSLKNIKGIESKLSYFDRITSFDRIDCLTHPDFGFRPLFYADAYKMETILQREAKYDLSFCGTIHTDRYELIQQLKEICATVGLREFDYPYLQSDFVFWVYKIWDHRYRKLKKSDFKYIPMSTEEVQELMRESIALLDIQHPNQSGLTMRAIESIGARRKLVTTNKDIINYDFYNPQNIYLFDRKHPYLDEAFFESEYEDIPNEVYQKYSITQWVDDVLLM